MMNIIIVMDIESQTSDVFYEDEFEFGGNSVFEKTGDNLLRSTNHDEIEIHGVSEFNTADKLINEQDHIVSDIQKQTSAESKEESGSSEEDNEESSSYESSSEEE